MADLSTSGRSCFPDGVLLDKVTLMGRSHDTSTTATTMTSAGCPIEVSFLLVDPPALTRCVINCPDLPCGRFFEEPPQITGADGAFLLLTAIFPKQPARSVPTDLFVYKSGPGNPSLQLLPHPYPVYHLSNHIGILSCGDHCLVVTQYATSIGVGKAASDAVKSFQRASEDIEKILERYCWAEPTARGKDVGDKINVAVGALDELLHTLPSVVLGIGRSMIPVYEPVNEVTPVFD